MSNLLLDEHPLLVMPKLATKVGLNEAIVLQQIHYWIQIESKTNDIDVIQKHYHDGRWYIYNTYEQWQKQFPFWCERTIRTIIKSLENKKLLITDRFNKFGYDRTKWYTIDYEVLQSLDNQESADVATSNRQELHEENGKSCQTNTIDYPLTTSKNYVKCSMVQNSKSICTNDYSYEIVIKQIKKICRDIEVDSELPLRVILYYCEQYERYMGKHHPKMRNNHYETVIRNIVYNDYDFMFEDFELMIDKHFVTDYGEEIDYNMLHFFTDGILENRMYETCY